jgi:hypothetical protein
MFVLILLQSVSIPFEVERDSYAKCDARIRAKKFRVIAQDLMLSQ